MIEEIKNKIDIKWLAQKLGLKLYNNDFLFSIYRSEKKPSLKLYPETNSYFDYSAGKGGDVINFYADAKRISISEAVKELIQLAGIELKNVTHSYKPKPVKDKKNYAYPLTKTEEEKYFAPLEQQLVSAGEAEKENTEKALYSDILHNRAQKQKLIYEDMESFCNGVDEKSLSYLTGPERGLSEEVIKKMRLFSFEDPLKLINYLLERYNPEDLYTAGIFNKERKFVFFYYRIIIPYISNGEIIYLRGRYFVNGKSTHTQAPKYIGLHSFSKNLTAKRFYNEDILKDLNPGTELLVTEGEFDTMKAIQRGWPAIGLPGIHNYPSNADELLKDHNIAVCFDNDEAGKQGLQRFADAVRKDITAVVLKNFKDLTEVLIKYDQLNLNDYNQISLHLLKYKKVLSSKAKLLTAKEIQQLDIPDLQWIVEGLIPEGLTILAGKPKSGKSWFALGISIFICRGAGVLGKFNTSPKGVLYLALEDNHRRIKDRINNILGIENDKEAPGNFYIYIEGNGIPKLNEGGIEELQKIINDKPEIKLIIVDTLGRGIKNKGKANNIYQQDYEIGSSLQNFAIQNQISLLIIHHTKKGKEDDVFDEISGSTGLTGAADTMLVIDKKGKLYVRGRDIPEAEYQLKFDELTFSWQIIDEVKQEKNLTAERREIIDLFELYNREMGTGEVAELLGKEKSNISKMLRKLVEDGFLESRRYGRYQLVRKSDDDNPYPAALPKPKNLFS